jgi:transposase
VKPFVKRQKSDALDAEAISEAAQRPSMRFVPVKSETQQANALLFKTRDLFVRQRTQIVNALRGHMAEFGWVAPKGLKHARDLQTLIADPACELLPAARAMLKAMLEALNALDSQISDLDQEITRRTREDEVARN